MTWWVLGCLSVGCYLFKVGGVLAADTSRLTLRGQELLNNLTPAVLSGLIIVQTFDGGGELEVSALPAGVATGAVTAWMKAPLLVVLIVASATTAVIRML
jgi:uncharacterized membrane protein